MNSVIISSTDSLQSTFQKIDQNLANDLKGGGSIVLKQLDSPLSGEILFEASAQKTSLKDKLIGHIGRALSAIGINAPFFQSKLEPTEVKTQDWDVFSLIAMNELNRFAKSNALDVTQINTDQLYKRWDALINDNDFFEAAVSLQGEVLKEGLLLAGSAQDIPEDQFFYTRLGGVDEDMMRLAKETQEDSGFSGSVEGSVVSSFSDESESIIWVNSGPITSDEIYENQEVVDAHARGEALPDQTIYVNQKAVDAKTLGLEDVSETDDEYVNALAIEDTQAHVTYEDPEIYENQEIVDQFEAEKAEDALGEGAMETIYQRDDGIGNDDEIGITLTGDNPFKA